MRTNPTTLARRYQQETAAGRERILEQVADESMPLVSYLLNTHYPHYAKAHGKDMMQEARDTIVKRFPDYDPTKETFAKFITPHIIEAFKGYVCELNGISLHYYSQLASFSVRPTS